MATSSSSRTLLRVSSTPLRPRPRPRRRRRALGSACPQLSPSIQKPLVGSTTKISETLRSGSARFSLLPEWRQARRSSGQLILDGKVTVNGSVCSTPQLYYTSISFVYVETRVDPGRDIIYVNGNRLPKRLPPKVYLALNKPKGYIGASGENKSVLSLFEDYLKTWDKRNSGIPRPRLFTVGRLDVATTGLIIVTNDGDFAQKISHPSSNLSKEYIAAIEGVVSKRHLLAISEGTVIEGAIAPRILWSCYHNSQLCQDPVCVL